MRVLITGGNGFLGSHIAQQARAKGWTVRALCLTGTPAGHIESAGVEVVRGDVTKPETIAPAMRDIEIVFHVAGTTVEWHRTPRVCNEVNAIGTRNVCRAALAAGVRRLVHTSTASTIGSAPAGERATDEDELWDLWETGIYSRSKFLAEREALQAGARGLDVVICCPHQMLGSGDFGPSTPGRIVVLFAQGKIPFTVNAKSQFVDVEDAAAGHILAAEKGRRGERYVLAGREPVDMKTFFAACAELTRRPAPRHAVPVWLVWLAAHPIEWTSTYLTKRPPLVTIGNANLLVKNMVCSIERARADLGFEPGSWRAALEKAVRWFADHGTFARQV